MTTMMIAAPALSFFDDFPGEFDEESVTRAFTEGDCWLLALALQREAGLPIALITCAEHPTEHWCHAGNMLSDDLFVDITGVSTVEEALDRWGDCVMCDGEFGEVILDTLTKRTRDRAFREMDHSPELGEDPAPWAAHMAAVLEAEGLR